jgi:hypothetical protein
VIAEAFYGYYHIEVLSSQATLYGMLSVNSLHWDKCGIILGMETFVQEIEFS